MLSSYYLHFIFVLSSYHLLPFKLAAYICIPVVPARGGAEVALGLCYRTLYSSTELACAVRQPGPCVRASCEPFSLSLSRNRTCARPRCNATPRGTLCSKDRASHCISHLTWRFALHTPHTTLHTSSHLTSSYLTLLPTCHPNCSQLFSSYPNKLILALSSTEEKFLCTTTVSSFSSDSVILFSLLRIISFMV
jgi:hypothetical protein